MFTGFTPETVDFLWGIRMNNNREWFEEHKKQYTGSLYQPIKALGQAVFEPFLDEPGNILKVSRIYRDARMHPPTPYKESLWLCIRRDVEWWAENPCLYFEITPDEASYGFLYWKPKTATMEAFRQRITEKPDEFLTLVEQVESATGQKIHADCYKRPKPTENPDLLPYFAWKSGIVCTRTIEPGEELFGPQLEEKVKDFFAKVAPLYNYFNQYIV